MFWLVISLVFIYCLGHMGLEFVNLRTLRDQRGIVPPVLAGRIDPKEVARAEDYTLARAKLNLIIFVLGKALLLFMLAVGGFAWLASVVEGLDRAPVVSGLLFFAILAMASKAVSFPFEWYETFYLEERFGFNRTTPARWLADMAKALLPAALLGGGLLAALLVLLYHAGTTWWLVCWAVFFVFSFVMTALYPVLIAPLFNSFSPLEEGCLKTKVVTLMERCRIGVQDIFVMDATRRSSHSNAYMTGFGRSKRIVLFDTLIEKLDDDEIAAVLAHEVGHWKKKHMLKLFLSTQAESLGIFALTGWLVTWPPICTAFGFEHVIPYAGLLLAMIIYSPVIFLLRPLRTAQERRHEQEADRYASSLDLGPSLGDALVCLSRDNLSNLKPNPLYVFFNYSHPPVAQRLEALDSGISTAS